MRIGGARHERRAAVRGELLLVEGHCVLGHQPLARAGCFTRCGGLDRTHAGYGLEGDFTALDDGGCDDRDRHHHVAGDRLIGDCAVIDAGGRLQRQALYACAHSRGGREISGAGEGAHVVQDRIERWPELDPHQTHHEALDGKAETSALGDQEEQEHEREDGVDHRLDDVPHHGQRFGSDSAHGQEGCVGGGRRIRPGGGKHYGGRVVQLLPGEAARVLDQVDQDVLAQQICGTLCGGGDLGLGVGLLDLAVDHAGHQIRIEGWVQLEGEQCPDTGDFGWQAVGELGVDVRAGIDLHRVAVGRKPRRIGAAHQRPDVGALGKGGGVDRAVLQVVERAVVDVGDHVGAQLRIVDGRAAGGLDQPIAEHDAVLLVGKFRG